jgi:hypothetical protein
MGSSKQVLVLLNDDDGGSDKTSIQATFLDYYANQLLFPYKVLQEP